MVYDAVVNTAMNIAKRRIENGFDVNPDDTVCVLRTKSGNIYTGLVCLEMRNGITNIIHSEIDAINTMKMKKETAIESLILLNVQTLSMIIPCNCCINTILSLNPENYKCLIITPGGYIRISEIGNYLAASDPLMSTPSVSSPYNSIYYNNTMSYVSINSPKTTDSSGCYLRKKVNNLLNFNSKEDEENMEIDALENFIKKKKRRKKELKII